MTPTATEPPPSASPRNRVRPTDHRRLAEDITGNGGADEAAARAAGMLPAELIQPGEIIILLLKPSAWFILLAPLRTLTAIIVVAMIADSVNSYTGLGFARQSIILATLGLLMMRVFWQFLEWLSRVYVLTDRRIITVSGVVRIGVFESPLERVQHTNLILSLRERLFALGTIAFATAGTALLEAYWLMLEDPLEVHQKIVQTISRYRR
jgi:PH (Pleckstrin Homology) domain-containing protein